VVAFHSMGTIVLYTALAVALLLWYGTGRQPLAAAGAFAKSLIVPRYLLFFLMMLGVLVLNKFELHLEAALPIRYNLTQMLTGWEGHWQSHLQAALHSQPLTLLCAVFYLVLFQAVMIASVGIYTYRGDIKLYYALCIALVLNYLIAVPFFLFVPVDEAWHASPHIRFLMLDVFPGFESEYRSLSGLNNCFPSLHTSLSVTMALLASRSGIRRWAVFCWIHAAVIIFSIFYLGIHWLSDMSAGLALACVSVAIGLKVASRADYSHGGQVRVARSEISSSSAAR